MQGIDQLPMPLETKTRLRIAGDGHGRCAPLPLCARRSDLLPLPWRLDDAKPASQAQKDLTRFVSGEKVKQAENEPKAHKSAFSTKRPIQKTPQEPF